VATSHSWVEATGVLPSPAGVSWASMGLGRNEDSSSFAQMVSLFLRSAWAHFHRTSVVCFFDRVFLTTSLDRIARFPTPIEDSTASASSNASSDSLNEARIDGKRLAPFMAKIELN